MSEYPIQFSDGSWGWRHALDDEPDYSGLEFEELEKKAKEELK